MATIRGFEDLDAWQMSRKLANEIYASSSSGAFARDFVLRDQVRRAAVSVLSNVAEGFERGGNAEFIQFLSIAKGSVGEVRAHVYIALDQGYIDRSKFEQLQMLASDVGKKLGGLIAYLKRSGLAGTKYKNPKPETRNPKSESREAGFSIVTAIFLIVVLALLGVYIVSVTGVQQSSSQLDVQGVRAYQAARAGIEWGAYQVLDPASASLGAPAACDTSLPIPMPACPASPTHIGAGHASTLGGSLSTFTVTIECTQQADTTEGNRRVVVYQIVATGCNQISGGSCLTATPATGYVERRLTATLTKCRDSTASLPRCACG